MGARDLLHDLADAGLSITADGDRLVIRPASKLTDQMREALREAKPELLAMLAAPRAYRLTPPEADAAHTQPWDDATIGRFVARVGLFLRRGIGATDADDLAERVAFRDQRADDRVCCVECAHYRPGRCGNHKRAGLLSADLGRNLVGLLQRCTGFKEP